MMTSASLVEMSSFFLRAPIPTNLNRNQIKPNDPNLILHLKNFITEKINSNDLLKSVESGWEILINPFLDGSQLTTDNQFSNLNQFLLSGGYYSFMVTKDSRSQIVVTHRIAQSIFLS